MDERNAGDLWFCPFRADITLKYWDDGAVVFNQADGHLQCLSPVYGQVFQLITQNRRWTAFELATELLGEAPSSDEVEHVTNALHKFASSNLIVRVAV